MKVPDKELMEFASPEWFAFLRQLLMAVPVGIGPATPGVICEVFTNVPPHLSSDASHRLAWTRRITSEGAVSVALEECADDEADIKLVVDYDVILPFARLILSPETSAAANERLKEAAGSGALRIIRRSDMQNTDDTTVHNLLAALTR